MLALVAAASVVAVVVGPVQAATTCTFTTIGTTMTLDASCTTDSSIVVPDGFTLDGAGFTITAVDPPGGHFTGAIVTNGGDEAYVMNLTLTASGLANVCDSGAARLRGIMFEGASGAITENTIAGVTQAGSGCQEGNSIEVREFGGGGPRTVEIAHNDLTGWMKTGIVVNGDVVGDVHHNRIEASANQANLAANSVQFGFGSTGWLTNNQIAGNQWCGASDYVATAVLIYLSNGVSIRHNNLDGNADVGIYGYANGLTIDNNRVFDDASIADCNDYGYDYGVVSDGTGNTVTNNKVRGYDTPYDGVTGGNNKTAPGGPID